MSSLRYKFLLDENVRYELAGYLEKKGVDVALTPKGLKNGDVAKLSLAQKRVLITRDEDFADYDKDKVLGVVFIRIPQNDLQNLFKMFSALLDKEIKYEGNLVTLATNKIDIVSLWE